MGKVFLVMLVLFVAALVLGVMLRRRDRGTELFVTEARGRQSYDGPIEDQVRALLRQRQKIQAIKLVRERTGLGLKEAKDAVEEFERTDRLPGGLSAGRPVKMPGGPAPEEVIAEASRLKGQRRAIDAIKLIRTHTGLGLKDAKDLYDSL